MSGIKLFPRPTYPNDVQQDTHVEPLSFDPYIPLTAMSFLLGGSSSTPSYAAEQLTHHLASISTLPIHLNTTSSAQSSQTDRPSSHLESALSELSSSRPPTRDQLLTILQSLAKQEEGSRYAVQSEMDRVVEGEVLGRAVTVLWKEVLDELLRSALQLEAERTWWDNVLNTRLGIPIYLLQSELSSHLPFNRADF